MAFFLPWDLVYLPCFEHLMGLVECLAQWLHWDGIFDCELDNFARPDAKLPVNHRRNRFLLVFNSLRSLKGSGALLSRRMIVIVVNAVIRVNSVHDGHPVSILGRLHEWLIALLDHVFLFSLGLWILIVKLISQFLLHLVAKQVEFRRVDVRVYIPAIGHYWLG